LITPAIPKWLPEKIYSGISFEDMIETARKWVKIIEEKEHPDLLIGLLHAGVDYTYGGENENTYKNENASKLVAEKVPGFDIVFVGHDHAGWNFSTKNSEGQNVLVLGTTAGARNVAVADVKLDYSGTNHSFVKESISGALIDMKDYAPDPDFMKRYQRNFNQVKNYVNRPIGEFTETISSRDAIFGPSKFVDLIQTIQLNLTDADVSFTAPLSFNAKIDKGTVYVKDMFDLYRYENLLYTMELTGQEIKDYLEYSYGNWFNQMKNENDHLLKFKLDENGNIKYSERTKSPELEERYYNFESAAGIDYAVDVTKPV
jgi:2',3'-cyclic-nucleotide 2'-phosphodiesterase/3'-nucleotidase